MHQLCFETEKIILVFKEYTNLLDILGGLRTTEPCKVVVCVFPTFGQSNFLVSQ